MTCLITMRSETYALRAERVLKNKGISAKKVKLDGEEYSIVSQSDILAVVE